MRPLLTSVALLSVAVLASASPVEAQERVRGRWEDVTVSLAGSGDGPFRAFRAVVVRGGAPHRLTLREDAGGRWELVVERCVVVPGRVGLAGALEGRDAAPTATWGDPRAIALRRSGDRLQGAGVDLLLPAPAPSPTDVGWFTDADDLRTDGSERRALSHALSSGSHDAVRALGPLDVNLATPDEKARLIGHLLDGDTTDADRAWTRELFDRLGEGPGPLGIRRVPEGEGARVLEALRRRGRLAHLASDGDLALFRALPAHVRSADLAAALVSALARGSDDRDRRLGAHWVLDRARAAGALEGVLARLAADRDEGLRRVLDAARPTRRAIVHGHRAEPLHAAENTGPAIESALARGATGVEIDLCVTRDGQLVLWHDADPDSAVALLRQLGLEGGSAFRPSVPALGGGLRQPIHQLTLAELRRSHGYSPAGAPRHEIPTLEEVAPLLAQLESVILDIKVPGDRPALVASFGRSLRAVLDRHGLTSRSILMSPDASVVRILKPLLPGAAATHDVEITRVLDGGDHSAVRAALALGNTVASVGRPVVPKLGGQFSYYLEVLRRDRARLDREGLDVRLIAWTIDDELELREVLAVGVDGVLTNRVDLALEVMRRLGLQRPSSEVP